MRDRMERLVVLPFSIGCSSHSSVAVSEHQQKITKSESKPSSTGGEPGENLSDVRMKNSFGLLTIPKPNISTRIQRLIKSFSQLFVDFSKPTDDVQSIRAGVMAGMEEDGEMEIEIGCPTDVKHVTHVGWDGCTTTDSTTTMKGWDGLKAPELLSSLHSLSLRQFELSMAAQANPTFA